MTNVHHLQDRNDIVETVDAVFDTVDAKDWTAARALFADDVDVDFSSLGGGPPARVTADQLVAGWVAGLHARKRSWHLISHYRVQITSDIATVGVKGYALNRLDEELGGGIWEVWGTYALTLRRADDRWLVTRFCFDAQITRGDDAVRTHSL
ncbi:nuclear transport factor 2 family protein [Catellatospora tritici]|uniref:nuclear transport factor 2 family protein n=1 Tax=Catellatospora tritici TaxID=2851566 RepID=UPI001C2D4536|nr:nuclear transport factor 2 family protein [Catellatospora tritici]MBV1849240.1 nuclear transport factor 2 family protein [Catellatospora tritici]